jgi:hypothetical protein
MRVLEPSELLQVWERGLRAPPAGAILPLLAAACPELPAEGLARLTVGERDALLLSQREWIFGPQVEAFDGCPACGERLELALTVDDLRAVAPVIDASGLGQAVPLSTATDGYRVEFRLPVVGDLRPGTTLPELVARCVLTATHDGEPADAGELPAPVIEAISAEMAAADPQAEIELALTCPACGHAWTAAFDIAAFLWSELDTWARRTLGEVHQLASAYGWGEADILALGPARRATYLAMIGAAR